MNEDVLQTLPSWNDDEVQGSCVHQEEQPCSLQGSPSATPTTNTVESSSSQRSPWITHKVLKSDTLAGIALKYNITIGDIKRANGLLSDNALFARDTIQIPAGGLHIGEDMLLAIAQVATGFGRDTHLNPEANAHPASAAALRHIKRIDACGPEMFPPDEDFFAYPWCAGGYLETLQHQAMSHHHDDEGPSEFELRERRLQGSNGSTTMLAPETTDGPTRIHQAVRKRRGYAADDDDDEETWNGGSSNQQGFSSFWTSDSNSNNNSGSGSFFPWATTGSHSRHANSTGLPNQQGMLAGTAGKSEGVSSVFRHLSEMGKALGEKIKAAATTPALAAPTKRSLAEAAEGVLDSFMHRTSAVRQGASTAFRRISETQVMSRSATADAFDGPKYRSSKAGGKDD